MYRSAILLILFVVISVVLSTETREFTVQQSRLPIYDIDLFSGYCDPGNLCFVRDSGEVFPYENFTITSVEGHVYRHESADICDGGHYTLDVVMNCSYEDEDEEDTLLYVAKQVQNQGFFQFVDLDIHVGDGDDCTFGIVNNCRGSFDSFRLTISYMLESDYNAFVPKKLVVKVI